VAEKLQLGRNIMQSGLEPNLLDIRLYGWSKGLNFTLSYSLHYHYQ